MAVTAMAMVLAGGWVLGLPWRLRGAGIGLIWCATIAAHLVLPSGSALRLAIGGSAQSWVVLGAALLLGIGYVIGLRWLRARAAPRAAAPQASGLGALEAERYARHLMLRDIGGPGQGALKRAKVLVVGAGGLGSSAMLYLAASGVGVIGVIDDDVVESSNLQRQIIHSEARLGQPKVLSAQTAIKALNRFAEVRPYQRRLDETIGPDLIAEYDLVLDGSDNFDTRYLVNRICVALGKPLITGAMSQWEGQLSVFDPARGGPCYQCVFAERPQPGTVPSCAEAGVAAPLPGIIGAMMAMEAVKLICAAGDGLRGKLVIHDALFGQSRTISVHLRADCPVCQGRGAKQRDDASPAG